MSVASRRVRRLRLRAPDAASARRTAIKLEDALRTASLPDAGGRLLLVRRLALGRIEARMAPAALALRIEQRFADSGAVGVHAAADDAEHADVVWFRDALEAHVLLACRLLRGAPATAWFWRLALPRVRAVDGPAVALRELAQSVSALPEAAVAVPHWVAAIDAAGGLDRLKAVLGDERWRSLQGVIAAASRRVEGAWTRGSEPAASVSANADTRARGLEPVAEKVDSTLAVDDSLERVAPVLTTVSRAADAGSASQREHHDAPHVGLVPTPAVATDETAAGGLPLLLNVLARLGYETWLDAYPGWRPFDIARRVFARVLAQLGIDPVDPAWEVAWSPMTNEPTPASFETPAGWREALGLDLSMTPDRERKEQAFDARVVQAWTIATRRWLRCYTGIELADLVRRPAGLVLTPTHLDVCFDHAQVELQLRRAGVDLDPGWLPWFGRVVGFRYERRGPRR